MEIVDRLSGIVGSAHVLTGDDGARYALDWTGRYRSSPVAVARPADSAQVAAVVRLAHETRTPIVPVSGGTGLAGGIWAAEGALMVSMERLDRIREIRDDARIAIVEAGVVLANLHSAAEERGLAFPLTFGAKGSAMIGGALSTNAGGSGALRHGSARDLCLGVEAVLPDGEVLDLMSELRKDNSGYDLRGLLIGAEGTLGLITAAVLKLSPKPLAYATAMVATDTLAPALALLNRLQEATGGAVEAFEYMPCAYVEAHLARFPKARAPFEARYPVNIMVEISATAPLDATPAPDGTVPIAARLEETLAEMLDEGRILDAVVARNEAQRAEMWSRREDAAEVALSRLPLINNDIAVPVDKVPAFLERMDSALAGLDAEADTMTVAHLGDGNVHYTVFPSSRDPAAHDRIMETVEDVALSLGGSFSAEHGIGITKLPSMSRRKNPAALKLMRQIKDALDPHGIMNPGKVLPEFRA